MTIWKIHSPAHRRAFSLLILCCLAQLGVARVAAQNRLDPAGMGRGQTSVAGTSGIAAIASNPGALDYRARATGPFGLGNEVTIGFFNLGGTLGSTFLSGSELGEIFSSGLSDQSSRVRLGEQLQSGRLFANGGNNPITVCWRLPGSGTLGLHYGQRLFSSVNLPDAVAAVLVRNELFEPHLDFFNEGVGGIWTSELGLSFGTTFGRRETGPVIDPGFGGSDAAAARDGWFPEVGVGATVKLLMGVTSQTLDEGSAITIERTTKNNALAYHFRGGYIVRSAEPTGFNIGDDIGMFQLGLPAGNTGMGVAADIGVHGVLYRSSGSDAVLFGLAVQDVGSVNWSTNAMERRALDIDTTIAFNGSLSSDVLDNFSGDTTSINDYSTMLPTVVRAGLAFNLPVLMGSNQRGMQLAIEGELPLNDAYGSVDAGRVSVGAEYPLSDRFALRGGLRFGGINTFGVGFGFGWKIIDQLMLDVGSSEVNSFFGGDRVDLAFRLTLGLGDVR